MEDTLRFLVEDSLHRLVAFVCTACSQVRMDLCRCVHGFLYINHSMLTVRMIA